MFPVKICDVATPLELVVSVSVAAAGLVAKVPLAPCCGAVKVTETPVAGELFDVTVTENAPNEAPAAALAVYPEFAEIKTVAGGVVFVLEPPHATKAAITPNPLINAIALRRFIEERFVEEAFIAYLHSTQWRAPRILRVAR